MSFINLFKKSNSEKFVEIEKRFTPHQHVFLRIPGSTQTYVSRIEDWDQERIFVSGFSDQELGTSCPLPEQKIEFYVLVGDQYLKADVELKEIVDAPLHQWILSKPKTLQPHKDRRRYFRLENVLGALVQEYPDVFEDSEEAVTKNLSAGGMLLISREKFELGTKLVIKLPELIKTRYVGIVVWKSENPKSNRYYYGVKFIQISQDEQDRLSRYISEKLTRDRSLGYYETSSS
jgi:c-di-GMP-binding flagellar brake protein YcgR